MDRLVDCSELLPRYAEWCERVQRMHPAFGEAGDDGGRPAWTNAIRAPSESRVMLVSSAGVHGRSDPPFDLKNGCGDESIRRIRGDTTVGELVASHAHYDTEAANEDINVVFPLDALRSLRDAGSVGAVSDVHLGFMGFVPDPGTLRLLVDHVVSEVLEAAPDIVVLSPG